MSVLRHFITKRKQAYFGQFVLISFVVDCSMFRTDWFILLTYND